MTDSEEPTELAGLIHRHRDGCNGRPHRRWYRGQNKCEALAALALTASRPDVGEAAQAVLDHMPFHHHCTVCLVEDELRAALAADNDNPEPTPGARS